MMDAGRGGDGLSGRDFIRREMELMMGTVVLVMVVFALLYVLAKTVATRTWRRFHDRRDEEEVIVIRSGRGDEGPRPPRPQLRRHAEAQEAPPQEPPAGSGDVEGASGGEEDLGPPPTPERPGP